jgi:16S rRNA processing protein RimM
MSTGRPAAVPEAGGRVAGDEPALTPMTVEVVVGVVGRPHGVRGEVTVEPRTDEPERRFAPGQELRTEGSSRLLTVVSMRRHDGRLLVRFAGLEDRTAVEAVRGARLVADVDPEERPAEPAEFYDRQLVGLQVRTPNAGVVGVVISVLHLPGQDLLEIRTATEVRLVPFVAALVSEVDLDGGVLTVVDLAGLLSEDDES